MVDLGAALHRGLQLDRDVIDAEFLGGDAPQPTEHLVVVAFVRGVGEDVGRELVVAGGYGRDVDVVDHRHAFDLL